VVIVSPVPPWPRGRIDEWREYDDHGAGNHEVFPTNSEGPFFGDHAPESLAPQPGHASPAGKLGHHRRPLRRKMVVAMITSGKRTPIVATSEVVPMHQKR